jgi:hypothetical protein
MVRQIESPDEDEFTHSVNAMYDQATIHAEKFFECVAIANAKNALCMEIDESDVFAGHSFGTAAVFGNAAGHLVAQVKKTFSSDEFVNAMNIHLPTEYQIKAAIYTEYGNFTG